LVVSVVYVVACRLFELVVLLVDRDAGYCCRTRRRRRDYVQSVVSFVALSGQSSTLYPDVTGP
jgi:hypothetical protein